MPERGRKSPEHRHFSNIGEQKRRAVGLPGGIRTENLDALKELLTIDNFLAKRPNAGTAPEKGKAAFTDTELINYAAQFEGFADKIRDLVVGKDSTTHPEEFGLKTAREIRDTDENAPSNGYFTIEWRVRMRYSAPQENGCGCGCGCACGG